MIQSALRGHEDWVSSAAFSPLIISRSNVPELSKNIIQKRLAFARDWSGWLTRAAWSVAPLEDRPASHPCKSDRHRCPPGDCRNGAVVATIFEFMAQGNLAGWEDSNLQPDGYEPTWPTARETYFDR
jgi:hypothetical protein